MMQLVEGVPEGQATHTNQGASGLWTPKTCRKCRTPKPPRDFTKDRSQPDGLKRACRSCSSAENKAWRRAHPHYDRDRNRDQRAYQAEYREQHREERKEAMRLWREANPEHRRKYNRRHALKAKYGLTPEAYNSLAASQDGRCAICHVEVSGKNEHIDHDHSSGVVRGILCSGCNCGLGFFADDTTRLAAAIEYLRRSALRSVA